MSQQLGNKERQGKARQTSQLHPGQKKVGFKPTTLCSLALYQLSYQGNSAGRGSNLRRNTLYDLLCAYTLVGKTHNPLKPGSY